MTLNIEEKFWSGNFGDSYIKRNSDKSLLKNNYSLFKKVLKKKKFSNLIELGANVGLNIMAINKIFPNVKNYAVEINKTACQELSNNISRCKVYNGSILDYNNYSRNFEKKNWDLVILKTVLIHVNPNYLEKIYKILQKCSKKYLLICEYYSPRPVMVKYRGHKNKLFKRDFAGEIIDNYHFKLDSYGFVYHKDQIAPQDDINWFLLKKIS